MVMNRYDNSADRLNKAPLMYVSASSKSLDEAARAAMFMDWNVAKETAQLALMSSIVAHAKTLDYLHGRCDQK